MRFTSNQLRLSPRINISILAGTPPSTGASSLPVPPMVVQITKTVSSHLSSLAGVPLPPTQLRAQNEPFDSSLPQRALEEGSGRNQPLLHRHELCK